MKDYIRKGLSGLILGTYLATSGYVRASEPGPEKIDTNNSQIVFSYRQPPELKVGRMKLDCNKMYLIDTGSVIDKPYVALDALANYLESQREFYKSSQGQAKINRAMSDLTNLVIYEAGPYNPSAHARTGGKQISDTGLKMFREAASNGIIAPEEYLSLPNGHVYVAQKLDYRQGSLEQGVIVEINHRKDAKDCYKSVIAETSTTSEPEPAETYQPSQPTPQPEKTDLEKAAEEFKPSEPVQPEPAKKESFGKRHPVWTWILIGVGAVATGLAFKGITREKVKDNKVCIDGVCTTGGDPY